MHINEPALLRAFLRSMVATINQFIQSFYIFLVKQKLRSGLLPQTFKLKIDYVNTIGQVVTSQQEQVNAGTNRIQLKVKPLISGTYILRFRDDEETVIHSRTLIRN